MKVFDKSKMNIFNSKEVINVIENFPSVLEGERNNINGLWEVKLDTTIERKQLNFIINLYLKLK